MTYSGKWSSFVRRAVNAAQRVEHEQRMRVEDPETMLDRLAGDREDPEGAARRRQDAFERWLDGLQ